MSNSSDARRFGGIARLYGQANFDRFAQAHVCVVGLGGVGSWCVEALVRSGVGRLTLIDGDCVAESNINRQLPALSSSLTQYKAQVLAERCRDINPGAQISTVCTFIEAQSPLEHIPDGAVIVDAIDSIPAKAALIAAARQQGRTIFVAGGAGGRQDPSRVRCADLALAQGDPLCSRLRTLLRKEYGFAAGNADPKKVRSFGVMTAFTDEPAQGCASDALSAAGERSGFGTGVVVTSAVGMRLAWLVLGHIMHPGSASDPA